MTVARVHQLWVFPVKSMRGTSPATAELTAAGLAHDRAWAVVDDDGGAAVTAAEEPRLRQVVARLAGDEVAIDVPGCAPGLSGTAADEALAGWLGRRVHLEHRGAGGYVDVAPVHLVSTYAMTNAAHAEQCDACDIRQPRANLVLELVPGSGEEGTESDWLGRRLVVGTAALDVVRRPDHCLGVYGEVATTGRVAVGDGVTLG